MNKPKLVINIIPISSNNKSIFIGKRIEDLKINFISNKLKYGEEFNDAGLRIIKEEIGLTITNQDRLVYICTYNSIDKNKSLHYVNVLYYFVLTEEEEKSIIINKFTFSSFCFATIEDVLNYKDETYICLASFLNYYSVSSIDDIKNISSIIN